MACAGGLSWRTGRDLLSSSAERVRAGVLTVELEEAPVTIVMGLDQHRARITAEWLDTATGEVARARVAPADRAAVRRVAARFGGQELEGGLEGGGGGGGGGGAGGLGVGGGGAPGGGGPRPPRRAGRAPPPPWDQEAR